jgi:hypothetical protein
MPQLLRCAVRPHIVRNAIKVSLVVGTVLNLINQGEPLLTNGTISWGHVFLNYLVPYCVASYSAAKNEASHSGRKP